MSDGVFFLDEIIQNVMCVFFLVIYFISLFFCKKESSCAAALDLSLLSQFSSLPYTPREVM